MRHLGLLLLCSAVLSAADKKLPSGKVVADDVAIEATLLADKDSVKNALGNDLGGSILVVDVKLKPQGDKSLRISRDDFTLKSDGDGQRSQPFAPSQIAGRGALIISSVGGGGGSYVDNQRGPVWGGYPGTMGGPQRLPGDSPIAGSGTADTSDAKATVAEGDSKKEDPLLAVLKEKVLPEKEITESLSGMLYFHMEGKQKPKNLELWYKSPSGKVTLRFK